MKDDVVTNKKFKDVDALFKKACENAGLPPTKRQASKWRNGYGKAYLLHTGKLIK